MALKTAMILAAGRGERLRPLTDRLPKPLVSVGSQTLIDFHLSALSRSGFERVVINVAHLGQQIMDYVGNGSRFGLSVVYSSETEGALETAGGIAHALPLLGRGEFLAVAGDVLCDVDYASLTLPESGDLHLVMVANPPHHPDGDFGVDGTCEPGRLVQPLPHTRTYTFSGVGVYRASLFRQLPQPKYPLSPLIKTAIEAGTASAQIHRGLWMDIGTPERLDAARRLFTS